MIIVEQGLGLSETDMDALKGTSLFESMLRNRIVVKFSGSHSFPNGIDFNQCNGFHHIRELGTNIYQVWFQHRSDYDIIRSDLITHKFVICHNDK